MDLKNAVIIGYTLDACTFARKKAEEGYKVVFQKTATLGHPLDIITDYISYEDVLKLKVLGVNTEFNRISMNTFAYIPYDDIKFVNTRNGLFFWPLCKSSFESGVEWEEVIDLLYGITEFRAKVSSSSNQVGVYKTAFPKWLFDSLLKHIGINKWGGLRQSKMSKDGLSREIDISCLDGSNPGTYYTPVKGYESLCEDILNHPNITVNELNIKDVRKFLDKNWRNTEVYLSDNRVDLIFGYTFGVLERVIWAANPVLESECTELMDISNGIVLTPSMPFWCASNHFGKAKRIYAEKVTDLFYTGASILAPAQSNTKCLSEYATLLRLQKGKILMLDRDFYTVMT